MRFNYQSIGSGGGQKQILAQTVDFGASDGPMSDENLAKAPGKILHIPTVAGAVVVTYNPAGDGELKLDGETLAKIFLGQITKWNDPAIAALNPRARSCPNTDDRRRASLGRQRHHLHLHRLPEQREPGVESRRRARTPRCNWPVGLGAKGNEGVAGQVKQLPGAIGYVELIYALQNKMPFAAMKNKAGEFVTPSSNRSPRRSPAQVPEDFRFSMVNAPGEGAYPIAGATWLLVYQQQKDAAKGKKLVEFLKWMVNDGEKMAAGLEYAPLPEALRERVLQRVETIKF